MNKLISLLPFFILVFHPIRKVRGNKDLAEKQNDDQDKEMEVLDDENNIMDRDSRSLHHNLFPNALRNIGILRSSRSENAQTLTGKTSNSPRELRSVKPIRKRTN